MKTSETTPAEFSARFGTNKVLPGQFSYFICDNGVGVIRDNSNNSIEIVAVDEIVPTDITPEDELLLLSLVCGEFKEDLTIPRTDTLFDYEEREKLSQRRVNTVWVVFGMVIIICLVFYAYMYFI
ncbi:hypothetical protein QFZ81_000150 [Paenibacillus sp. V4I9]|uniref:hypothetical protein n=1 Tax=Paenibacillus sp. V4I9 TaxID=3042308 RepID=UPI002789BD1E|nr:hypothetical protein [Paenibacillus sp. V4I9]MDQ0885062.1 hypothetical protein [Paenibacillus sp. V4I9]